MDLDSTLDAIDAAAVHHCGHCDTQLGPDAPSKYWCSPEHQEAWNTARSEALVGYVEPEDLPQHVYNQVEGRSPETTPMVDRLWEESALSMALTGNAYFQVVRDEVSWDGVRTIQEIRPLSFGFRREWLDEVAPADHVRISLHTSNPADPSPSSVASDAYASGSVQWHSWGNGAEPTDAVIDETHTWGLLDPGWFEAAIRAAQVVDWRPTGIANVEPVPVSIQPEPESIEFEYEWKPVPFLAEEEPPLPVMPEVQLDMERIQRLVERGPRVITAAVQTQFARRRIDPRRSR